MSAAKEAIAAIQRYRQTLKDERELVKHELDELQAKSSGLKNCLDVVDRALSALAMVEDTLQPVEVVPKKPPTTMAELLKHPENQFNPLCVCTHHKSQHRLGIGCLYCSCTVFGKL